MSGSSWTARWEVDVAVVVDVVVVDAIIVFKIPVFDGHKHVAHCSKKKKQNGNEQFSGCY